MTTSAHQQGSRWPARSSIRVLLMLDDQPQLVDVVKLALHHVAFVVLNVPTLAEATAALATWQPHHAEFYRWRGAFVGEEGYLNLKRERISTNEVAGS